LAAGAVHEFSIAVNVTAAVGTTLSNTARVATAGDSDASNDADTDIVTVR
jgi:hypothetical protein